MIQNKHRKCVICRELFIKRSMTHKVCGPDCAQVHIQQTKDKAERKETIKRKKELKTRSDYIKEAQIIFNRYIRERDKNKPCICCGMPLVLSAIGGGFDCGHYRSVGSAPHLRYDERNAHGQRKQCNRWGAGRAVDYRLGLIARIGQHEVDDLEANNDVKKYTIEELKTISSLYKAKLKGLTNESARSNQESF